MSVEPIRLFVAADPNGCDAESLLVLEHSLRKNTPVAVDIHYMMQSPVPGDIWNGWATEKWSTPFSGFRWAVPAAAGFRNRAIYCDSDFVFLTDLRQLWEQEFLPGKVAMVKGGVEGWRFCLTMWNCEEAKKIPELAALLECKGDPDLHRKLNHLMVTKYADRLQVFSGDWNNIDGEDKAVSQIDALHYSSMCHQLHGKYAAPRLASQGRKHWFDDAAKPHWRQDLQTLFDRYYQEALDNGMKVEDFDPGIDVVKIVKESQKGYSSRPAHSWAH